MADIDSLSIQISANAEPAAKSIGDLASAVRRFNSAVAQSNNFSGLTALANAAKTAAQSAGDSAQRLQALANALSAFGRSGRAATVINSIATSMGSLRDVANEISRINTTPISSLVNAMTQLSGAANNIRMPTRLADDIVNLGTAAELVSDVDWSSFERMAAGLRSLEGLGQIRIPHMPGAGGGAQGGNAPAQPRRSGSRQVGEGAERAGNEAERANSRLAQLRDYLAQIGNAGQNAGNVLSGFGNTVGNLSRGLLGLAKVELRGFTLLPRLFSAKLGERIKGITKGITGFVRSIGRIALYRFIRTVMKEISQAFSEGMQNLYQWSLLVDRTFANSMDKIATSMQYLKNSLAAMVAPLINALAPAIDMIVDKFVSALNVVNQFFAAVTWQKTYTVAKKVATEWAEAEKSTKKSVKEMRRTILAFDEINPLTKNRDSSGDSDNKAKDYGSMFETRTVSNDAKEAADAFKNLFAPLKAAWAAEGEPTIAAALYAFNSVKKAVQDVWQAIVDAWTGVPGMAWLTSTLQLLQTMLGIIGDIANAFDTAWNDNNAGYNYIASIFGVFSSINNLLVIIGNSFREAWNSGVGVSILSNILSILTGINNIYINIAGNITKAWNASGIGVSIWNGILSIVNTVLSRFNQIVTATANWAAGLNFEPILSAFNNLLQAIRPVVDIIGGALAWVHTNVLLPLGKWSIEKGLPALLNALSGAFTLLSAVLNVVKEPAQAIWNNFLKPIGQWTGGVVVTVLNGMNSAFTTLSNWITENKEQAGWLFDAVVGFLIGITAANAAPGIITAVTTAVSGLTGGIGLLVAAFSPVKLAIAGVIAVGYLLITHWDQVKEWAQKLGDKISEVWGNIKQWTSETWGKIKEWTSEAWSNVSTSVMNGLTSASTWVNQKFTIIKNAVSTGWNNIKTWTSDAWSNVSTAVMNGLTSASTWVNQKFTIIKNAVSTGWNNIKTWTSDTWSNVSTSVMSGLTSAVSWVNQKFTIIKNAVSTAWTNVKSWTSEAWSNVSNAVMTGATSANSWISQKFTIIGNSIKTTWDGAKKHTENFWDNVQDGFTGFTNWIHNTFSGIWNNAWTTIVDGFGSIFNTIGDKVKPPINAVIRFLNSMISKVESAINTIIGGLNSALSIHIPSFGQWVWTPFGDKWFGFSGFDWSVSLPTAHFGRINELAQGGILDSATWLTPNTVAGEAGKEAVLPLETNTGWMDMLAERVSERTLENANQYSYTNIYDSATDLTGVMNYLGNVVEELRAIRDKDNTVEITTRQYAKAQQRANRRAGVTVIPVGT